MSSTFVKLYDTIDPSITSNLIVSKISNYNSESDLVSVEKDIPIAMKELTVSSTKTCTYCMTNFKDELEQKAHYKLDWHRFNLKQALFGRSAVGEEEFDKMADDVSSISGSESDSSDESESENVAEETVKEENRLLAFRDAKIFWRNQKGDAFSIYKCLLLGRREVTSTTVLQESLVNFLETRKKWMIIMLGGGHFAAAVFDGSVIKVHKTFHCYTVRAKQGGGQSSRDGKGGNRPKSAGASLRRYNELSQIQHVQEILKSWSDEIDGCSLILYRAVGPHNRAVLFSGKTPPLDKTDTRLRSIPFATRRATLKEVKRIHDILSTLQCHGPADILERELSPQERKETPLNSLERSTIDKQVNEHFGVKKKSPAKSVDRAKERATKEREIPGSEVPESSSGSEGGEVQLSTNDVVVDFDGLEEFSCSLKKRKKKRLKPKQKEKLVKQKLYDELETFKQSLIKACLDGDAETLKDLIVKAEEMPGAEAPVENDENTGPKLKKEDFESCMLGPVSENGDSLLHLAAIHCKPKIVSILLKVHCNPTLKNKKKMVPYVLSGDKETKAAFKRFVADNPDLYDPKESLIPLPLSDEQEALMLERKKEKRKQQKEREKKKKKENYEKKVSEDDRVRFLALSDREKRAVAAERRIIQALTVNTPNAATPVFIRCFLCGRDMTGKVPFEYNSQIFCTTVCLKAHRAKTNSYGKDI